MLDGLVNWRILKQRKAKDKLIGHCRDGGVCCMWREWDIACHYSDVALRRLLFTSNWVVVICVCQHIVVVCLSHLSNCTVPQLYWYTLYKWCMMSSATWRYICPKVKYQRRAKPVHCHICDSSLTLTLHCLHGHIHLCPTACNELTNHSQLS